MVRLRVADPAQLDDLLDAAAYDALDRGRLTDPDALRSPYRGRPRARMLAALGHRLGRRAVRRHPGRAPRIAALTCRRRSPSWSWRPGCAALAARNRTDLASFLGAGVYRHWSPPAVDQLLLRGEWYTAYTPYQPEVSQGTLQSIYEYESLIAELVGPRRGVGVALRRRRGHGRGGAHDLPRHPPRARARLSRGVHPHYRADHATYFEGGLAARRGPARRRRRGGRDDGPRRARARCWPTRIARSPGSSPPSRTSSGSWSRCRGSAELAHAAGALFVAVVEPVWLAVLAPPGAYGADIAAGEGQPLGIAPQYGGPYLGHPRLAPTRSSARSRAGWSG